MFIHSRIIGFILLGSALLMGSLRAGMPSIQGEIKGPDGKPVPDAELRLERKDAKAAPVTIKADQKGHYAFINLAMGSYKVVASKNGLAATAADNIRPRAEGSVRVDFDLKKQTGETKGSALSAETKHMVWVPSETGSHLGGRWVEVDDRGKSASGANLDRANGDALRKLTLQPDSTPIGR
jgi:hypothetical protein